MSTQASATFQVTNWEEKPFNQIPGGAKLTRATVTKVFRGELEGDATVEYLMVHRTDGTAAFVGVEHVIGKLSGKPGAFVLEHEGTFENGKAKATCRVVTGTGTGELEGLEGRGHFEAEGKEAPFALDYELGG
jgi:hypothetical protein